jgi:hypothetical protein
MTLERQIQFFATETLDLHNNSNVVTPSTVHKLLSSLVASNNWNQPITPALSSGLVSAIKGGHLEGAFFYDKSDNFPTIGRGLRHNLLQLAAGETLREIAHFIWFDLTKFAPLRGINAPTQGLLVIEYSHFGPKAGKLNKFIMDKSSQRYQTEVTALNEPGALARVMQSTHIKSIKVKEYDPTITPGACGLHGLLLPADLHGIREFKYEVKPTRGGLFGISSRFKSHLSNFSGNANVEIRVVFEDGVELPLDQADMIVRTANVHRAAPNAKSVDPTSMLSEIRQAFHEKAPLLSQFFHRDIK